MAGPTWDADGVRMATESWTHLRQGRGKYRDPSGTVVYEGAWVDDWPDAEWCAPVYSHEEDVAASAKRTDAQNALCDRIVEIQGAFVLWP